MKTARKALLIALCAVLLVCASVMGTLAYLTDSESVVNTVTVGNVHITLDEAPVDGNGEATTGDRVQENAYHLVPGGSYDKDPTIHVAETSDDCWLFVEVVNNIANIEGGTTIAEQMAANGWIQIDGNVYGRETTNTADDNVVVFATFEIRGDVDNDELAEYEGETITITAYAIQAAGFDTAADAWAGYEG